MSLKMFQSVKSEKPLTEKKMPDAECREFSSLQDYLSLRRPAFSWADDDYIKYGILPLAIHCDSMEFDGYGNIVARVGNSKIAWSSHTDTAGKAVPGWRLPVRDGDYYRMNDGGILGADDGTGVWLMANMIRAGKEGIYIFHRAEEIGGLGSDWIAVNTPHIFDEIDICIALDRKGTDDVITFQGGMRCCSDAFADSLAAQLPGYQPDDTGVFTDSANYTHLISECTNLSVGYAYEHSSREYQLISHADKLLDMLLSVDESKLVVERDNTIEEYDDYGMYDFDFDYSMRAHDDVYWLNNQGAFTEHDDLVQAIDDEVDTVAIILTELGIDADYIRRMAKY